MRTSGAVLDVLLGSGYEPMSQLPFQVGVQDDGDLSPTSQFGDPPY